MKGTKLLTSIAALGLVLTVGACDGGQSAKVALCQSLDDIFDSLEENGGNYHLQMYFNQNYTDYYDTTDEVNEAISEGNFYTEYGAFADIYYTEDALLFIYDWDLIPTADGFDSLELFVNNYEDGTLDYYALYYTDATQSEVYLNLAYSYGTSAGEPTTWQEGFWSLLDLVEDRDKYTAVLAEGESEVSGAYTQYDMNTEIYQGLYEALFVDNEVGYNYCWPSDYMDSLGYDGQSYFGYYLDYCFNDLLDYYEGSVDADTLIKYAGTSAYWYDLGLWQVTMNSMCDWYIWKTTQGTGKQTKTVYYSFVFEIIGNVTEVGKTEITEELIQDGVDSVNAMLAMYAD